MSDELYNRLYDLAGPRLPRSSPPAKKKPEKGVPWSAKVIDGDYYVPLRQVAELLAANAILPAVRKGIEARVRAQDDRKRMGI